MRGDNAVCDEVVHLENDWCLTRTWGKEKEGVKLVYEVQRIAEFCHPTKKLRVENVDSNTAVDKKNFDLLVNCKNTSALSKFMQRPKVDETKGLSMCVIKDTETVYNQIIKNSENSDFIKTLNLKDYHLTLKGCCKHVIKLLREEDIIKSMLSSQGSEDWKKLRQLRITGSRCYSLFTYKQDNWNLKADKYFWPKSFVSKFTEYGKKYEQNAMKAYKTRNKTYEVFVPGFVVCKFDSQGRGLYQEMFKVYGNVFFKPGATLKNICNDIKNLTRRFTMNDYAIVIGAFSYTVGKPSKNKDSRWLYSYFTRERRTANSTIWITTSSPPYHMLDLMSALTHKLQPKGSFAKRKQEPISYLNLFHNVAGLRGHLKYLACLLSTQLYRNDFTPYLNDSLSEKEDVEPDFELHPNSTPPTACERNNFPVTYHQKEKLP
ncbi:hypothetical protein FQR65_LT10344 [Abscondita terminalis]|nr:hypothetical protein FQR65_LT10344 [Abscondita terminalis]